MEIEGQARRIRVYIGESDHWNGKPLAAAIVDRARQEHIIGATVVRGIEGYGGHNAIHSASILTIATDLPLIVEIIDSAERIDPFLPILGEMVTEGLITVEDVRVFKYAHE